MRRNLKLIVFYPNPMKGFDNRSSADEVKQDDPRIRLEARCQRTTKRFAAKGHKTQVKSSRDCRVKSLDSSGYFFGNLSRTI